jgi:hypothetical protein
MLVQFDGINTPKAFANFSPGLLQPWDKKYKRIENAEIVRPVREELLSELGKRMGSI